MCRIPILMSSRNIKTTHSLDLNVKGSAMGINQNNTQTSKTDAHVSCRREAEKLRRELNAERNTNKKLKTSLSEVKPSCDDPNSGCLTKLSSLKEEHEKDLETLQKKHVEVLSALYAKHGDEIQQLQSRHKKELEDLRKKSHEDNLSLTNEKEKFEQLIISKDEQIEKLKNQVAESLDMNSRERQGQIDELMKELKLVSDEAAYLKNIVQQHSNFAKCQKCSFYEKKYTDVVGEMATQTEHCKQLMAICSKMENQLTQQDELCMVLTALKSEIMK